MMQKNSIEIHDAERTDIPAIAVLEKECFSVPWSEKAIEETMSGDNALFIVAKIDGEICGYIGSYIAIDEGYITNIAVSPLFRRRGIGRALVGELKSRGEKMGLKFWTLEVRMSNLPAIALYKKMGFEKVGRRPRFYSEPTEDAELMTFYMRKGRED